MGRYTAFCNNQRMVKRKVEKLKHMKLEVMKPMINNKAKFSAHKLKMQDQST